MRHWLILIICLMALLAWYTWFFRYQPLQGPMLLDHWRGEVINLQGGVIPLEEHRRLIMERQAEEARQKLPPGTERPSRVTPEQHMEYLRQILQEGQNGFQRPEGQ